VIQIRPLPRERHALKLASGLDMDEELRMLERIFG